MADREDDYEEGVHLLPPEQRLPDDATERSSVWAAAAGEELDDLDDDPWSPPTGGVTSLAGGDHLDVGTASGPVEMQDWTEAPTGNVRASSSAPTTTGAPGRAASPAGGAVRTTGPRTTSTTGS